MPVDIAGIRKRGVEVAVPFFGDEIIVTYDPITVASPEFRRQWDDKRKELQAGLEDWINSIRDDLRNLPLREDFPGREHLVKAGIETVGDVPTTAAELKKLRGVGDTTARAIIRAINTDQRIDDTEFTRRREALFAEMAVMLVRNWDLTEGGEPLPVEVDSFLMLPGLAEAVSQAVWRDVNSLGNPMTSNGTKPGLRRV